MKQAEPAAEQTEETSVAAPTTAPTTHERAAQPPPTPILYSSEMITESLTNKNVNELPGIGSAMAAVLEEKGYGKVRAATYM